ncbi:MAG: flippase [Candidatus Atribacteria bacterium]|nr:flippase [Candidatus Atribacteria bacterium]
MIEVKKIAKNTLLIFVSQILYYILTFFTVIYTARYLGADGFGILSLALSITGIFAMFIDMGLSTFMVREVSRDKSKADKYIPNVALMRLILSLLTILLIILLVNVINYAEIVKIVIYILTISVIINGISGIFSYVFQANEKMEYLSMSTLILSISMLTGTLIGVYYQFDILYFAYLYIISNGLVFIFIFLAYLWKFNLPKIKIDWNIWKPTLKEAWPFGVAAMSGLLYTYIDSILLSIFQNNTVVGWYSAAYRLMLVVLFIPNAFNTVIFPVMSPLFKTSPESLRLINERYFKYMVIIGIPLGFGTTFLAQKIILLVYGSGYTNSILSLQILIWTMVFTFIGASFVQVLQSINKQLIITKIAVICVIINVILNLILIPSYSYIGASIATVLTEIILVGYTIYATSKLGYGIRDLNVNNDLSKVIIASSIMSTFILYFNDLNFYLLVVLSILLYLVAITLLRVFDDADKLLIKNLLNR